MSHYVLDGRTATRHFPGIGRYTKSLVQAMVPLLQPNEQLTILEMPQSPIITPESPATVHRLVVAASVFSMRQQWMIPWLLKRLGADLYHTPYYLMPYLPGVLTLLTVYDLIPILFPAQSTWRARILFRGALALALRTALHKIAISHVTCDDLQRHFPSLGRRTVVIPLAVDPKFRPQTVKAVATIRQRYCLPDRFVLYLGSNKPHKNLVRLVKAWSEVRKSHPNVVLIIAGYWSPRYPEARRVSAQLGLGSDGVRWLGSIPEADLPPLYAAAELFVFPSLYEGFGLPVLEAMACGTPVACSNVAALLEVAGDAAEFFDPRDTNSIAGAVVQVLDDESLRVDLRARAVRRAAQFSWHRTAQETLALYRRLLSTGLERE